MKKLILLILLTVVVLPQLSFAEAEVPVLSEDEVIWETEQIPYLHDVLVAPQGELLYNIKGKTLEIRRISDGVKIDSIVIDNVRNYLYKMSITDDGRYMAFSGDNPYVIIYDLQARKEVKRLTTIAYERIENGKNVIYETDKWLSSSISPDGTRITGVVIAHDDYMTSFVVIDIKSEEVLLKQQRIHYDIFNPSPRSMSWISAEFSPDGKYIVAQVDFITENNVQGPDSVYIYDVNTLEVYDLVLNTSSIDRKSISFSHYKPLLTYRDLGRIYIYDIQNKKIIENELAADPFSLLFSRNSNHIIYGFDFQNQIYDINTKETIYEYTFLTVPKEISLDNSKMFGFRDNKIYAMKTFFTKSTVVSNPIEIIISPNPTNGLVNITLDCKSPGMSYQINNTSGQNLESKIINSNNNSLIINFSNYPAGIYYLTINCNNNSTTYKIVREG